MKTIKLFFFSLMCLMALNLSAQQYVDLGLPSGTKWKSSNETGGFYTYEAAVGKFSGHLPNDDQWLELRNYCDWTRNETGCKVVGPNGNFIFLPASGNRDCDGNVEYVGVIGVYWSSTPYYSPHSSELVWVFAIDSSKGEAVFSEGNLTIFDRCYGLSVRLVQSK